MTKKQYELKCHEINSWHIEKDGKVIIFDLFKSDAEIIYNELNNLVEENEQLKKVLSDVAKDHEVTVEDLILWSEGLND